MATRSTIKFYNEFNDKPIATIYRHYDGYVSGAGHELANWLKGKTIIGGIQHGQTMEAGFANGMGCLAAQFIAEHKTEIGSWYMTSADETEIYNYHVKHINNQFIIEVDDIFKGTPDELLKFTEHNEE